METIWVADGNSTFKAQGSIFHLEYGRVKQTKDRGLDHRPISQSEKDL